MKRYGLVGLVMMALTYAHAAAGAPKGWFLAGSAPELYQTGLSETVHEGKHSAYLRSIAPVPKGFGTLMQSVEAAAYAGKRVRLSAFIKTDGVKNWSGLWMRVDGPYGKVQAFDNMQDRPIKGTSAWQRYDVVLDVPEAAQSISFGVLLNGVGSLLIDQAQLEGVGKDVPTTSPPISKGPAPRPQNLAFEE